METREDIETTINHDLTDIMSETRYYKREYIEKITRLIPSLVTHEKNYLFMKLITLNEVEEGVFQMKEGTAPSPDGFTVNFIHHFWELVKMEAWRIL